MKFGALDRRLLVVVGAGGVGKTTLAAALGLVSARWGSDTLVMTFDPSLRLKDALGVVPAAKTEELRVTLDAPGKLYASLLDAQATFDGLVRRYAPDEAALASSRIASTATSRVVSPVCSSTWPWSGCSRWRATHVSSA